MPLQSFKQALAVEPFTTSLIGLHDRRILL
jgi:hypothetical protein